MAAQAVGFAVNSGTRQVMACTPASVLANPPPESCGRKSSERVLPWLSPFPGYWFTFVPSLSPGLHFALRIQRFAYIAHLSGFRCLISPSRPAWRVCWSTCRASRPRVFIACAGAAFDVDLSIEGLLWNGP
eukprot:7133200-Pyramimonas_sp.AAC.1